MRNYKEKEILIFESAWDLLLEKGYYETKISEIAKNAGIGKGTIYEYFKSKEDMVQDLIVYFVESRHLKLSEKLEKIESPEEKLRFIGQSDIENGLGIFKTMKVISMIDSFDKEAIKAGVFNVMQARFILIQDVIEEGIRKDIFDASNAKYGSILFTGTMNNAMMIENLIGNSPIDNYEILEYLIDKLKK